MDQYHPQVATAQFVRHNSIPDTYWVTWAPADATCEDTDKSRIALSEHASCSTTGAELGIFQPQGGCIRRSRGLLRTQPDGVHPVVSAWSWHCGCQGAGQDREGPPGETYSAALAWLLRRSPVMLPIPGTSSIARLEENVEAAALELSDAEYLELTGVAQLAS